MIIKMLHDTFLSCIIFFSFDSIINQFAIYVEFLKIAFDESHKRLKCIKQNGDFSDLSRDKLWKLNISMIKEGSELIMVAFTKKFRTEKPVEIS